MLAQLNLYCHGYIAIPIIEACHRHGLFELLDDRKFHKRKVLIKKLKANVGYFAIALQYLESIGWLEKNSHAAYRLTSRAESVFFNQNLSSLYAFEPQQILNNSPYAEQLCEGIDKILTLSQTQKSHSVKLAEGAVILPLIMALKQLDTDHFCKELKQFDAPLVEAIEKLFIREQWLTVDKTQLTKSGIHLLKTSVLHIAASYRPMLNGMADLLFGNHTQVFSGTQKSDETHVDRALNVMSSGLPHDSCFDDLQLEIISIFNRQPIDKQPQAIVDMGCGDGSLLKQVYRTICEKTVRGQHRAQFPILLIGVDNNQQALEETTANLADVKHHTVLGDINKPDKLQQTLEQFGLTQEHQVLHICSFGYHNISIEANQPIRKSLAALAPDQPDFYLDNQGNLLSSMAVLSRWYQHLKGWSQFNYQSHLLVLELHTLPVQLIYQKQNQSENFYFDTIHHFSHQYLISAEAFIILAANVGLFNRNIAKRFPKTSNFCRISLHQFTKRDYIIRHAVENDLKSLYELENLCWPKGLLTPKRQIRARLKNYPQGQFVLEKEGRVLGVIYSQRIADVETLEKCNSANVHRLHQASGSTIQLLAINILPQAQNLSLGDQLLEFMLQRSGFVTGVNRVVGVTRCKNYNAKLTCSYEQYIHQQAPQQDPVLAFHQVHGGKIVRVMPNYRPTDTVNEGYGVLVSYDVHNRVQYRRRVKTAPIKTNSFINQQEVTQFVQDKVIQLLGVNNSSFDADRPIMEMGLNSADLLDLQLQISAKYNLALQPGFFFEYNSINKILVYLATQLTTVESILEQISCADTLQSANTIMESASSNTTDSDTDIAIIGMSCRLPGNIDTPEKLWQLLKSSKDAIRDYPQDRGEWPSNSDKPAIDRGGFIADADTFDASFFRISPKEAEITDPQQRILLQQAWACLEDAGISPAALKETNTGVYIGASNCDYSRLIQDAKLETQAHSAIGSSLAVLANRLSYFFDFCGPSLLIDTACSSSLVAIHSAIQSLRSGECNTALVGGVNFICHPELSLAYHKAGMLAADGKCKVFDSKANGYVRAEGAVMLLIKPLSKAIEEQDQIHAVIKGSAINHGGLASGLTVPNPKKQCELLTSAWKNAGISARDLTYLEAHGTGTSLGDPIEIQGIQTAYNQLEPTENKTCAIGSVKSNLGHLESAAGITGLLKVILSMKYRQLPATINFKQLNPKIILKDTPFYIIDKHHEWDIDQLRLAGVSSFGSGGANAHVVIEEYVLPETKESITVSNSNLIIPLSARTPEQLRQRAVDLLEFINRQQINSDQKTQIDTGNRIALKEQLEKQITTRLARLLSIEPTQLEGEQSLKDYGVERLHLTQLLDNIDKDQEFNLNPEKWLQQDSISSLVEICLNQTPVLQGVDHSEEQLTGDQLTPEKNVNLTSIAYTLQTGREAMEVRVAFMVNSVEQLSEKLGAYVAGMQNIEGTYQGQVKGNKDALSLVNTQEIIDNWISRKEFSTLPDLWVKGLNLDWNELYSEVRPRRISLPTYPFSKDRYWIDTSNNTGCAICRQGAEIATDVLHPLLHNNISELNQQSYSSTFGTKEIVLSYHQAKGQKLLSLPTYPFAKERYWADNTNNGQTPEVISNILHPLLHNNRSDFSRQSYSSTFSGKEFFLKDHLIKGQKVLPAVAYLEMARAAVENAVPEVSGIIELRNITWTQPVVVSQNTEVSISLFANDNQQIDYEIYSADEDQVIIHCRGKALFSNSSLPAKLDLEQLQGQMRQNIDINTLYHAFINMGISYGKSHRALSAVSKGDNQLFAQLTLPSGIENTMEQYLLHPCLMDSALQASVGLTVDFDHLPDRPLLPFALESISIFYPCTREMYVWVRYAEGSKKGDKVTRLDIDLMDQAGNVCIKLKGFISLALEGEINAEEHIQNKQVTEYQQRSYSYDMPLLKDHKIEGASLLVGGAYLSMMIESAKSLIRDKDFSIEKVQYYNPLTLEKGQSAQVSLQGKTIGQQIHFSATYVKENNLQSIQASEGILNLTPESLIEKESIANYVRHAKSARNTKIFYQHPKQKVYGPSLYSVEEVFTISETKVLGKIKLTDAMLNELPDYVIHPCILDACHVLSAFSLTDIDELVADYHVMPIVIEKVVVKADFSQFQESEYYCIAERKIHNGKINKIDLKLLSKQGEVICLLAGFTTKKSETGTLFATHTWQKSEISQTQTKEYKNHQIILCEIPNFEAEQLEIFIANSKCTELQAASQKIGERYNGYALSCFELIREIVESKTQEEVLIQLVIPNTEEQTLFIGLYALLKTAELENARITGQVILTDAQTTPQQLASQLQECKTVSSDSIVNYHKLSRFVLNRLEVQPSEEKPEITFKDGGVYLITGGLGGLGLIFAKEILKQTSDVKVILTGRSELNAKKQTLLEELQSKNVEYQQVDITESQSVTNLIDSILEKYKTLTGIIHSAGVIEDNFILKKSPEEFTLVMAPKVAGTINIDEASKDINLNFMVLFSSVSGAIGNIGQVDYAAANGFMDQFAAYRNHLVSTKKRTGKTVSINWPLWQDGGMRPDQASRDFLRQTTGMIPMQTEIGLQAFYQCLAMPNSQTLVMEGSIGKIRHHILPKSMDSQNVPVTDKSPQVENNMNVDTNDLLSKVQSMLIKEVSKIIELGYEKIQLDVEFDKYGFDSIVLMDFVKHINQKYELELMPTIFFEYSTIRSFADYLCNEHQSVFVKQFSMEIEVQESVDEAPTPQSIASVVKRKSRFKTITSDNIQDIAIIGMDGLFPESNNIEEFWNNIQTRKNLIKEVPIDHWDYQPWYDSDRQAKDKTYCKWGSFIDQVDKFDASFFNISPREAEWMDPQLRLLLQSIYKTGEDAALINQIRGSDTGVFVGVCFHDYSDKIAELNLPTNPYSGTGNAHTLIANRASFLFDLTGPSVAVDTACSSSLFALHQACNALRNTECSMAFVGGVNLLLSSQHYRYFSSIGALSPTGRCHTFDAKADGYVPGEAIACILIKPLQEAIQDGNKIYGVIKGSAALHGGFTPSLTAPSVSGEKNVIVSAWKNANIDPSSISYIEAHGTGTKLGDPIEITALNQAFREFTGKENFCAIGSAKSNIGHTEGAAGIVGVIKVIEQMRKKEIPAMPFYDELNPFIQLNQSPLFINEENMPWTTNSPRRAGINSFGFSGAYAHVVLEEYIQKSTQPIVNTDNNTKVIVPVSAGTPEQLRQRVSDLLGFIHEQKTNLEQDPLTAAEKTIDLTAMAYTLQKGREAMEERLGFIVNSVAQLSEKLQAYVSGEQDIEDTYRGQVKGSNDTVSLFSTDTDLQETVEKWISRKKHSKLLDLWTKGVNFDWNKLYSEVKPRCISLPTYPFAKERYWIDVSESVASNQVTVVTTNVMHPLLHSNTSDLNQQCYCSTFSGEEFFLSNYRVLGQKILPVGAYLEMARIAVEKAVPNVSGAIELQNIIWAQPFVVGKNKEVSIALFVNDNQQIDYEIYSSDKDQEMIHCQGKALFCNNPLPAKVDIMHLQGQMQHSIDSNTVYNAFAKMGMRYRQSQQPIEALYKRDNQLLAQLILPATLENTLEQYLLHPGIMEGVLQASIWLMSDFNQLSGRVALPIAIESLSILSPCTKEMFALVRYTSENVPVNQVTKLDIDLMDQEGNVCVAFKSMIMKNNKFDPENMDQRSDSDLLLDSISISEVSALQLYENENKINVFEKILDNIF